MTEAAHHLGAAETVKPPRAILLRNSGGEENRMQSECEHWVFLKITTFSFISLKEKV